MLYPVLLLLLRFLLAHPLLHPPLLSSQWNYLTYWLSFVNLSHQVRSSFVFCGKCDTLSVRGEGCKSSITDGDVLFPYETNPICLPYLFLSLILVVFCLIWLNTYNICIQSLFLLSWSTKMLTTWGFLVLSFCRSNMWGLRNSLPI